MVHPKRTAWMVPVWEVTIGRSGRWWVFDLLRPGKTSELPVVPYALGALTDRRVPDNVVATLVGLDPDVDSGILNDFLIDYDYLPLV